MSDPNDQEEAMARFSEAWAEFVESISQACLSMLSVLAKWWDSLDPDVQQVFLEMNKKEEKES